MPEGSEVVEAKAPNRDFGFVREGQPVHVKLEAFPFTRYGLMHGVIEQVSRDAVEDEKEGLVFAARVRLPQPWLSIGGRRFLLARA